MERPTVTGSRGAQVTQMVKNWPATQETQVRSLSGEASPGGGNGDLLQRLLCVRWGLKTETRLGRPAGARPLGVQRVCSVSKQQWEAVWSFKLGLAESDTPLRNLTLMADMPGT